MSHKAIVMTDWWAAIIGTLLTTCIVGGATFAWNAHGETRELQTKIESLEEAKLPSRLDKLEAKVDYTNQTVLDLKVEQAKLSDKMDYLVQRSIEAQKKEHK